MQLIELNNISKSYKVQHQGPFLTTAILRGLTRVKREIFWALKNISFEVGQGESIGIIGENGAGKSTLLRILTGVTLPTTGSISRKCRISSLLDLGAGFHPYLTGRENIFLNAVLLGMEKKRIKDLYVQIVDFSGLREFIDAPVYTYSNGMYLRLGFSIAVHLDTDLLIVDEVLAVGDEEFQRKSLDKVNELLSNGKSLVLVSHDLNLIKSICKKVGWLSNGKLLSLGDPNQITSQYLLDVSKRQGMAIIDNFPLTLVFQKGKLLIFWHGIELTKNLCGYTSIFCMGAWQDSTQAQWEVKLKGNKLTSIGTWFKIPVVQTWEIEINGNNIIWQMNLKVKEPLCIDHETINLMLSENYTNWQMQSQKDKFPQEFSPDFWSRSITPGSEKMDPSITPRPAPLYGAGQDINKGHTEPPPLIRATNNTVLRRECMKPSISLFPSDSMEWHLPKVSFDLDAEFSNYIGVVSNTDSYYRARVIQYERKKTEKLYSPENSYYFRGIIRIG